MILKLQKIQTIILNILMYILKMITIRKKNIVKQNLN